MIQIIPAILPTSERQYRDDIRKLAQSETLIGDWVHIDFMDNIFVHNKSIEPQITEEFPVQFQKEAHLMVMHPKEWIDKLVIAGFKRVIFHIECQDSIVEVIDLIKDKEMEVGIAIKGDTPVSRLEDFADKIDIVLIMSVVPGFQGQPFILKTFDKIKELKARCWDIKIGVDGAIKDNNIKEIIDIGVDFVIVGSYLLNGDVDENIENLWEIING